VRFVAEDRVDGYTEGADRLVRALRAHDMGVEYRTLVIGGDATPSLARHRRDTMPDHRAVPDAPTIARMVPPWVPQVRRAIGEGPLIWQTVWETERLPPHWVPLLNDTDRVIVPTEWNRDAFVASGVTRPIEVVPHVACDPVPGDGGEPLDLPDGVIVFYSLGEWNERKQPAIDLRAFLEAFTADDPVALVIKTRPFVDAPSSADGWAARSHLVGSTALEVARIMRSYRNPPPVRIETGRWTAERIAGLHTRGDCFLSLTHAEGWHLGAFDAAAYGNPVVMTGWGGQLAYLRHESSFLVSYDLEGVRHRDPGTYPPDQRWATPRIHHAVELLRAVARDIDAARRRAAPQRDRILHDYASARVVEALTAAVPEMATALDRRPT
jgi:hypothetical protein